MIRDRVHLLELRHMHIAEPAHPALRLRQSASLAIKVRGHRHRIRLDSHLLPQLKRFVPLLLHELASFWREVERLLIAEGELVGRWLESFGGSGLRHCDLAGVFLGWLGVWRHVGKTEPSCFGFWAERLGCRVVVVLGVHLCRGWLDRRCALGRCLLRGSYLGALRALCWCVLFRRSGLREGTWHLVAFRERAELVWSSARRPDRRIV